MLSTVRPNGRPHVTPLLSVWLDDAAHFCTGPDERRPATWRGTRAAPSSPAATRREGLDVVIEGEAVRVTDEAVLRRVADA